MDGKILGKVDDYWIIEGDKEGNRYKFNVQEWRSSGFPIDGMRVSFIADGENAKDVFSKIYIGSPDEYRQSLNNFINSSAFIGEPINENEKKLIFVASILTILASFITVAFGGSWANIIGNYFTFAYIFLYCLPVGLAVSVTRYGRYRNLLWVMLALNLAIIISTLDLLSSGSVFVRHGGAVAVILMHIVSVICLSLVLDLKRFIAATSVGDTNINASKISDKKNVPQQDKVEDGCPFCGGWNSKESKVCQYCKKNF